MLSRPNEPGILKGNESLTTWVKRLVISLTILAWLALAAIFIWAIGQIFRAFVLALLGATIATVVYPLVRWLEHKIARPWAVTIVYIIVFCLLGALLYYLINTIIIQVMGFIHYIQAIINSNGAGPIQPVLKTLQRLGISQNQIRSFEQNLVTQLQGILGNIIPLLSNVFDIILDIVLIVLLSIYFLLVGPRIVHWLRTGTPVQIRGGTNFLLDTLERVIGGNFRGTFILGVVLGVYIGIGAYFIGVPFPFLLGSIAFVMEFIPVLGFYITAITAVLFGLTHGWITGLITLGFVILGQALEGEILAPRIVGHTIGIHPILIIVALIAGVQLFGILGAFYSGPVTGLIQSIFLAVWHAWKERHPEQFPKEQLDLSKPGHEVSPNAGDTGGKPG
ncbi:MAG TPA: AI-2E family transporter [Ktedonobacteraceae bacterium]|jgi:predicted PurR-regulated permease PerM|nr:AI-2E family transporter [Ktedonobacteraceae bacterium]